MPSYVVSAAGDQGSSQQIQQIQQLNSQVQQITSQIQQLNQRQQASESQWGQIQQRFEQMIVDVGATISTLQTRLASLEAGQPDRVVLFELKERVALFEGKEKEKMEEKNDSRTRRKIRLAPSLPTTLVTVPEADKGYHAPTQSSAAPQN